MHEQLVEHLNAEISLGTITDVDSALQWLKETFFYIRAQRNPKPYFETSKYLTNESLDQKLQEKLLQALRELGDIKGVFLYFICEI